jgi:large subunit ribosomal protein L18
MIKNRLQRRHYTIRKKVSGNADKPRLCVKRSNKNIYAILIDDLKNKVITSVSTLTKDLDKVAIETEGKEKSKMTGKTAVAYRVGQLLAQKAKSLSINQIVFDRAGYRYHGRVKALAEGARKGGLKF